MSSSVVLASTTTSAILPGSTPLASSAAVTSTLALPTVTTENARVTAMPYPPMTTHWSKPISCTWTYIVDNEQPPSGAGPIAWLDLEPIPGASTLSCYPDGMFAGGRTGVFSPATCPNGWTTVSISVNTDQSPQDATTTALCCSSEYTLDGGHCKRQVPTVLAVPITYNHTASTYEIMTNSTTTLYGATIAVNTIRALFRDDDQAVLGITDDSEIDDDPEPWHLSIPAKIGIGVGVTIFGLLTIAALLFLFFRRRQRKRDQMKGRSLHEMEAVHGARGHFFGSGNPPLSPHSRSPAHDAVLPHDYDAGADTNTLGDNESGHTAHRDDEIRVLMAQKAAIQRRIEELERGEEEDDDVQVPTHNR
ncbi:hypothetical protein PT974_08802 [Cladobotryum mycophilum]|uniref:Uncharacterized protein n=1 Tax=Cladobotryum mycophilum TaxID=491253 RepID=A0ABR0SEC5_9HYPO